ncbi:MAG: hypothetical protein AMXMBFR7_43680 [Planctomycetota bacterium]
MLPRRRIGSHMLLSQKRFQRAYEIAASRRAADAPKRLKIGRVNQTGGGRHVYILRALAIRRLL